MTVMPDPVFTDMAECCEPDWDGEKYVHNQGCERPESNYKKEEGE
jgi:hypothetical protein